MAIVYCTHNKINGKKYIGSHSANNPNYLGSGFRLKIAVKKHNRKDLKNLNKKWKNTGLIILMLMKIHYFII